LEPIFAKEWVDRQSDMTKGVFAFAILRAWIPD